VKRRIGTASLSWLSLFVAIGVLACSDSHATTYYWDTNGANSGIGSAGGAAADWLTDSWATGSTGIRKRGHSRMALTFAQLVSYQHFSTAIAPQ
jgi:hypothetical protein